MKAITKEEFLAALDAWDEAYIADVSETDLNLTEAIQETDYPRAIINRLVQDFRQKLGGLDTPEKVEQVLHILFVMGMYYAIDVMRKVQETQELQRMLEVVDQHETVSCEIPESLRAFLESGSHKKAGPNGAAGDP